MGNFIRSIGRGIGSFFGGLWRLMVWIGVAGLVFGCLFGCGLTLLATRNISWQMPVVQYSIPLYQPAQPANQTNQNQSQPSSSPAYLCNATKIGAPTTVAGSCTHCTINYTKPGVVYIVGSTPMSYNANAWVWQYNAPALESDFQSCIQGQSFFSDSSYIPTWK
jgi:hypothetical protein